jgi:hypothetical protein
LLSCESEKDPCDIEYKLNEPGGYGRNEVTFLIDNETVWYSKGSGVSTGGGFFGGPTGGKGGFYISRYTIYNNNEIIKDSNIYTCGLERKSSIECQSHKYFNYYLNIAFGGFNLNNPSIEKIRFYLSSYQVNKPSFSNYSTNQDKFKVNVYIDMKDSICYGDFEGIIYQAGIIDKVWRILDSVKITKGVFDFKFSEINEREIEN